MFGFEIKRIFKAAAISDLNIIDSKQICFWYESKQYLFSVENSYVVYDMISSVMSHNVSSEDVPRSRSQDPISPKIDHRTDTTSPSPAYKQDNSNFSELMLSESDWRTLLEGAVLSTFHEKQVVLDANSHKFPLLQIAKGWFESDAVYFTKKKIYFFFFVKKKGSLRTDVEMYSNPSEIIGIVPFLNRKPSPYALIADTNDTQVYFFEGLFFE